MNIKELTNQLYELSVGGYFNGEKFTKERLTTYITNMCQPPWPTANALKVGACKSSDWLL